MNGIKDSRKTRLVWNTISSFSYQIVAMICGFILPRLILQSFGSEVNGLVNSINQFLTLIAFLELGVGAVIQSSLYKPLAEHNSISISEIITSGNKFFNKIAIILLIYIMGLIFAFPLILHSKFSFIYTATLILAISMNSFSQYYFGVIDRLLLTADQRGYVQYIASTISIIVNTIVCSLLIYAGASIQVVKLTTSLIYLIKPIWLRLYVNKRYHIDRKIKYNGEPIKQKWNGMAQHIAAVILDNTDTVILTLFSELSNVSIYSVYHLVVYGIKTLLLSMANGMQALLGELWAKQQVNELHETFGWFEWLMHTSVIFVFGCTGILIIPFVSLYTLGVNDANYIQPLFAFLIVCANACHCIRLPYNMMILAAGHYKQTQSNYIIASIINIVISVATVKVWGLVGVAIGTLIAMLYQTIWMAYYDSKHILRWPFKSFIRQLLVDILIVIVGFLFCAKLGHIETTFAMWIISALEVSFIWLIVTFIINYIFYKDRILRLTKNIFKKFQVTN